MNGCQKASHGVHRESGRVEEEHVLTDHILDEVVGPIKGAVGDSLLNRHNGMVGLAHAAGHLGIRSSMDDRGAQFNWRVAREWVWSRGVVMSKHATLVFRIDRDSRCWNGNTLILRRRQPRQGKRMPLDFVLCEESFG